MKIGTLCYACDTGLGILNKAFYDNGVLTDVMVVYHDHHKTHMEWYPPGTPSTRIKPWNRQAAQRFCQSMDVMLFIETPFDWNLIPFCQGKGIRTVLMPMYECMPAHLPSEPDEFLNPSKLDAQYFPGKVLTIPVEYPWRQREKANVFVHNAGQGSLLNRNGTKELLRAIEHVESKKFKLIVRSQQKLKYVPRSLAKDKRVEIREGVSVPYEELFAEGDVFIFPETFNGLSLPLQEARASGMLVMTTDRFPINTWLPKEALIPTYKSKKVQIARRCVEFDQAILNPKDIAAKIDEWVGQDITKYSLAGRRWAERNSWEKLAPQYVEFLCNGA